MPTSLFDINNLPEREEDIDFSDIEQRFQIPFDEGFDTVIVVDNVPLVDEKKEEKLLNVVKKLFKSVGEIREGGIWMPSEGADGKKTSKGYLFIEYETPDAANQAVKKYDNFQLDRAHSLAVNRFSDIEKYSTISEEYTPPTEEEPYQEKEHLKSWLTDPQSRDQWVVYRGDDVSIFWNRKTEPPEHMYSRTNWTETYVQWSPLGSYLTTFHRQGIVLWGGPSWSKIVRFVHPGVKLVDFSPNERYLVSWSNEPISLDKIPEGSPNPFSEDDEGNQVVIWDVLTGQLLRSFAIIPSNPAEASAKATITWPMFKWSPTDSYFARITPGQQISVYEAPGMGLVGKKSVKIEGVKDFEWSPAKPDPEDKTKQQKEEILSYWTPEILNQPARVTLMAFPSKTVVCTKNLFNVKECKLHWQSAGDFLAVKIDRSTKSKKTQFTSLEIFRLNEKDIPVEAIEIKEPVIAFAWEPMGERFGIITTSDLPTGNPGQSGAPQTLRTNVGFYYLDKGKAAVAFKRMKTLEKKTANTIFWSPKGRHVVLATLQSSTTFDMEFWDLDYDAPSADKKRDDTKEPDQGSTLQLMNTQEHYGVTDIEWDPTGRYVISASSIWRPTAGDHGFTVWDFRGVELHKQNIDKFKQLLWRPRPKTLLNKETMKKVRKNLREYSRQFDEEDAMTNQSISREHRLARRRLLEEWSAWRNRVEREIAEERKRLGKEITVRSDSDDASEVVEEWVEEVIEEIEEEVIDE